MQTLKYLQNIITEQKTFNVNIKNKLLKVQRSLQRVFFSKSWKLSALFNSNYRLSNMKTINNRLFIFDNQWHIVNLEIGCHYQKGENNHELPQNMIYMK